MWLDRSLKLLLLESLALSEDRFFFNEVSAPVGDLEAGMLVLLTGLFFEGNRYLKDFCRHNSLKDS